MNQPDPDYVFRRDGDAYLPSQAALSPWSPDLLHGGPTAALLARAVESVAPAPEFLVARFTVDLFRPVPARPLTITAEVVRSGRRIAAVQASVFDGPTEVSRASSLLLRRSDVEVPKAASYGRRDLPDPRTLEPRRYGDGGWTPPPGFHLHIEVREFRDGPAPDGGRSVGAWLRFPFALFEGEQASPFVYVASLADFANGLASVQAGESAGFINCDIDLRLHREPVGEWICMEVEAAAGAGGIGANHAVLSDLQGRFGMVTESLLLNERSPFKPA